jgi:phosphomannomutase
VTPVLAFGTDGWRGVIAREATFETYRRLARAAANRYRSGDFGPGDRRRIVVGHDPRFLSEEFARVASEVFQQAGIDVLLTDRPLPTPAVSWHVRRLGLSGGIVVTASHNPAEYNGFKLKAHFGGSASPEIYEAVEREVDRPLRPASAAGKLVVTDLVTPYRRALGGLVDKGKIRAAGLRVVCDAMHGAAADGLAAILGPGASRVESFRADRDAGFGGSHPEPIAANLSAVSARVREGGFDLAVAMDGDADRLGVLGPDGGFVSAHRVFALLLLHAFRHHGLAGGIAKTFSTSLVVDRIAARLGVPLYETGIGFKYIADLMIAGKVVAGGEESGGYGFAFHLPERDGTLSALLLLEFLAMSGRKLPEALADLAREFGSFEYARRDVRLPERAIGNFLAAVSKRPPAKIAGHPVTGTADRDGVKLLFGSRGWLLLRRSGTEPMIRLYCEHEVPGEPERILDRAQSRLAAHAARGAR